MGIVDEERTMVKKLQAAAERVSEMGLGFCLGQMSLFIWFFRR